MAKGEQGKDRTCGRKPKDEHYMNYVKPNKKRYTRCKTINSIKEQTERLIMALEGYPEEIKQSRTKKILEIADRYFHNIEALAQHKVLMDKFLSLKKEDDLHKWYEAKNRVFNHSYTRKQYMRYIGDPKVYFRQPNLKPLPIPINTNKGRLKSNMY